MTLYRATVQVVVRDEAAEMLHALTGIEPQTNLYYGPRPSTSAEIEIAVESDDATGAVAQALHDAAALADEAVRWTPEQG